MSAGLDAGVKLPCNTGEECAKEGLHAADQGDHATARKLLERACERDHPLGCKWLSLDLDHDWGPSLHAESARAQAVMEKACVLKELDSCRMLATGHLYGNRPGVARDPERAARLYQKGCEDGDGASCDGLANCYADGLGVAKDKVLAKKYRKRAAELGFVGE